jgi:hypothetical protein
VQLPHLTPTCRDAAALLHRLGHAVRPQVLINLDTGDVDRLDKRDAKTLNLPNLELSLENGVLENNDPHAGSRTQMSSMRVYRKFKKAVSDLYHQ